MKTITKFMALLLALTTVFCLSACGEESATASFDCKYGEEFSLDGMTYKIVKAEYNPQHDSDALVGIQVVMLCASNGETQSLNDYDGQSVSNPFDVVLTAGKKEYNAEPRVGFHVRNDDADKAFDSRFDLYFSIEKDVQITSITVYLNRGEENEEKVAVDMRSSVILNEGETEPEASAAPSDAAVSSTEAETVPETAPEPEPDPEIQWMQYRLVQSEKRFEDDEPESKQAGFMLTPQSGDETQAGMRGVVIKLIGADGAMIPASDINYDTVDAIRLTTPSGEEYKPNQLGLWGTIPGVGVDLTQFMEEGFWLVYLVPEGTALSDLTLSVKES